MVIATQNVLRMVDEYWAGYFGCQPEDLYEDRTLVVPHAALQGHDWVLVFRHDPAVIVSVPETVPEIGRRQLRGVPLKQAFDPKHLARSLVVWPDQISPPGWVGVCRPEDFRPVPTSARFLTDVDLPEIQQLARDLGESARWVCDLSFYREATFGLFSRKELVAASGYVNMGNTLAYIGVVVHPRYRGQGYAKRAASACIEYALDQDLIPMWRSLATNRAAIAVARSLGFRPYASTLDVRLTQDPF